jgi:beta-mannosidase
MPRARLIGSRTAQPLNGVWEVAALQSGSAQSPSDLSALTLDWVPCEGAMTVAAALRAAGRWSTDHPRNLDADEWWYRCCFAAPDRGTPRWRQRLLFDGLATVADVWLNGTHVLRSESMFVANAIDAGDLLPTGNELVIRFHALQTLLAARRARPKWRTGLVAHQQLRWHRTALLGRMPAWCPPIAPVGPWRPIRLEPESPVRLEETDLRAHLDGDDGIVRVSIPLSGSAAHVHGTLSVGDATAPVTLEHSSGPCTIHAAARVPQAEPWWPHTHGRQPLYAVRLSIDVDGEDVDIDLGRVGFRSLEIDRGADGEGFSIVVNGVPVFCRGACWTPLDLTRLDAGHGDYRAALERLRDAGMNMLRIGGTMAYETDTFHDLCDELGILVWQDFMFANMDYPADETFERLVTREAQQLLRRLQGRPSITVLCGSSEVEQQASMFGLPAERWRNPLFDGLLPGLVGSMIPDAAWVRSTPSGGLFPFHTDRGVTHYYGVGAYLRPFDDVRRAGVRFAAECLAFSNVPEPAMVDGLLAEGVAPGHHPRWKAGVPRDAGAGWDFEDVRDHYVRVLFNVEPTGLRARDADRYLALGRTATGEAMLRTFAELRRPGSSCRGGLVWFARDLRDGAGWGVIDYDGRPKAAYWYLKRVFASVTLLAIDEGLNGLWLHALNDTSEAIDAELRVTRYRDGHRSGASTSIPLTIPERGSRSVHADALFDGFVDLTYAYRFGPPQHDVVAATLRHPSSGAVLAAAHCFPCGLPTMRDDALGLVARAEPIAGGYIMTIETNRFAHAVAVEAEGFDPDDNYVHVEPGEPRRLVLRAQIPGLPLHGRVSALNGTAPVPIAPVLRAEPFHVD